MDFSFDKKMVCNAIILAFVLTSEGRRISPRNHESGAKHIELQQNGHRIEERDSNKRTTSLQPFYVTNSNTVYGGYSSKPFKLEDKNRLGGLSVGSTSFYKQDLFSYIKQGDTPNSGIFGYAAHFDPSTAASDYTFFKSISNDKNKHLEAKTSSNNNNNVERAPEAIIGQKMTQTRIKNANLIEFLVKINPVNPIFSQGLNVYPASKMTSEKTAISTCGGCQLVMIGPQGELSSSNIIYKQAG